MASEDLGTPPVEMASGGMAAAEARRPETVSGHGGGGDKDEKGTEVSNEAEKLRLTAEKLKLQVACARLLLHTRTLSKLSFWCNFKVHAKVFA